jgi:hypothetical protein
MDIEAAYQHYIQGMAAMLSEAAVRVGHKGELFELISPAMVDRFHRYHKRVLDGLDELDKEGPSDPPHRLRQSVRAFVSNDLGVALHSLWQRTGEEWLADRAAARYKEARKANPDFVLPYYYNALLDLQRGKPDDAERWRARIEALEPQWRNGRDLACYIDITRARGLEEHAALIDEQLEADASFGARLSTPIPTAPGPQLEVGETATQLAGHQNLRPDHRSRLAELAAQDRTDARDLRQRASRRIVELFPRRAGERWPWQDNDEFDWRLLEDPRRCRQDELELRWEHELDDFLLRALTTWITGQANALDTRDT